MNDGMAIQKIIHALNTAHPSDAVVATSVLRTHEFPDVIISQLLTTLIEVIGDRPLIGASSQRIIADGMINTIIKYRIDSKTFWIKFGGELDIDYFITSGKLILEDDVYTELKLKCDCVN